MKLKFKYKKQDKNTTFVHMIQLSIITINRNNKQGLLQTVLSVRKQTFTDFEYIVIDGASTDGSIY